VVVQAVVPPKIGVDPDNSDETSADAPPVSLAESADADNVLVTGIHWEFSKITMLGGLYTFSRSNCAENDSTSPLGTGNGAELVE
jgi:hypothetical protein